MLRDNFRVIDISLPLTAKTAVEAGEQSLKVEDKTKALKDSRFVTSTITMSAHLGTHVDSPLHILADKPNIGEADLKPYAGYCFLIDLSPMEKGEISAKTLMEALNPFEDELKMLQRQLDTPTPYPPRILIKTQTARDPNKFKKEYPHLEVDAVMLLQNMGVYLVGIDTPSVDPLDTDNGYAQKFLVDSQICWLENLDFTNVERAGFYMMVAAPLKLMGAAGSPVRALLFDQL